MNGQRRVWLLAVVLTVLAGCDRTESGSTLTTVEQPVPETPFAEAASQPGATSRRSRETPPADQRLPVFATLAAESGFDFTRYDDMHGQRRIVETNGGGVGLIDFDADGQLDIFMTNGCRLPVGANSSTTLSALFRNLGDMQFERTSSALPGLRAEFACGCAVGDIDNDGFDDLYVTAFGTNTLWKNNGDGTFAEITAQTGTSVPAWSTSAAFADINRDGHLDLYVVNYLDESAETPHLCPNPASPTGYEGCSPAIFNGVDDALFLSDGAGSMKNVSATCGLTGLGGKGLGVVITDLDGDDVPEIYVANDGEANFLFRVIQSSTSVATTAAPPEADSSHEEPEIHLVNEALASATALNESGFAQASMGIAAGDYDEDGATDLFLTHFFGDTNTLYRNAGSMFFSDETRSSRLGAPSRQTLGFGTVFFDANLDGWLDLFIANGHVDDRTWMPEPQPYQMPAQLLLNRRDGAFFEVSAGAGQYFDMARIGRGVAAGDLDNDGKTDLVVSHQLAPSVILHNRSERSGESPWFGVRLIGSSSNRNGIGATLTLQTGTHTMYRTIVGGGSFQSAISTRVQFHVQTSQPATLEVRWPSGIRQRVTVHPGRQETLMEHAPDPISHNRTHSGT